MRTLVFDNEAVQALIDPDHHKHRTVLAHLEGVVVRRRRGVVVEAIVPTTVRVEACWDRSKRGAAAINRFGLQDRPLDTPAANLASAIRARTETSIADAHVGAVVRTLGSDEIVVLSSDPDDMKSVCDPVTIRAVRI